MHKGPTAISLTTMAVQTPDLQQPQDNSSSSCCGFVPMSHQPHTGARGIWDGAGQRHQPHPSLLPRGCHETLPITVALPITLAVSPSDSSHHCPCCTGSRFRGLGQVLSLLHRDCISSRSLSSERTAAKARQGKRSIPSDSSFPTRSGCDVAVKSHLG